MTTSLTALDRAGSLPLDELTALVRGLLPAPAVWGPLVADAREERQCRLLMRDDLVEVWVISWGAGQDTGFHDHGGSEAVVGVALGAVVEERLRVGGPPVVRRLVADGGCVHVPSTHVHRVRHIGGPAAVSIHAYSPPLGEMGAYSVGADGVLERFPITGDTTLEPVEPEAGPEAPCR